MQVRALKTFTGRYGTIRAGTVFNCEPGYFQSLAKNNLVTAEITKDAAARTPGPSKDRNIPEAPHRGGKENPGEQGQAPGVTVRPLDVGAGQQSSSLRADLALQEKTSNRSAAGVTSKSIAAPTKKKKTRVVLNPADKGTPPAGE
jgi:hypothetical protein